VEVQESVVTLFVYQKPVRSCGVRSWCLRFNFGGVLAVVASFSLAMTACGDNTSDASNTSLDRADGETTGTRMERIRYGDAQQAYGTLSIPQGEGPFRVVVLIHGGFWREQFGPDLMDPLALDLADRGLAVWNFDYRAVGDPTGGWPGTFEDVGAAIDYLAKADAPLDLDSVVVVGHSAGGHLALWTGSRAALLPNDPGANPQVMPAVIVAQAPVVDLIGAAGRGLGANAVQGLLGGEPAEFPERYRVATPGPGSARVVVVHGDADRNVPPAESAMLDGNDVASPWFGFEQTTRLTDPEAEHFAVIDPEHSLWQRTLIELGL
jgi:acetyl esterase/lipase